jgi:ketosteroid isomerase-like protein
VDRDLPERVYAAWNRGDVEHLGSYFAPDAIYETSGQFPGFEAVYEGPEGMVRFHAEMLEAWDSFQIEIVEIEAEGEDGDAAARVRFRGRGATSGVEVDLEFGHAWCIEDGLIRYFVARPTAGEAMARLAELRAGRVE